MTLADIITDIYHELRSVDGLEQYPIRDTVNVWNKRLHEQQLFEEALLTQTFTWAVADGTDKSMSAVLTNWRGLPHWITDTSDTDAEWAKRPIREIKRRRLNSSSEDEFEGHRAYSVNGVYLMLVSTPSAALTVTIDHYQSPPDLDDLTDSPLLPAEFHRVLVDAACVDMWAYARKMSGSSYDQRRGWPEEEAAQARFSETWDALVRRVRKTRNVELSMDPGPIFGGANAQMRRRRWGR